MNKRILILFSLLFSVSVVGVTAQDLNEQKWESANANFAEGNFAQAARDYEAIVESGVNNWELFYNLGSAYYKDGNLGRAILNFERAERLNPRNSDIEHNLEVAKARIVDKIDSVPEFFLVEWAAALRDSMSPNAWTLVLIGFFVISALFFVRWRLKKRSGDFTLTVVFAGVALFALLFAHNAYALINADNQAVVLNTSSVVRSSPDAGGKELFLLHEGTKVELLNTIGNFDEIQIASGNKGWILSGDIEKI